MAGNGRLTTHVLDMMSGKPAAGMRFDLLMLHGDHTHHLVSGVTNEDGRGPGPLLDRLTTLRDALSALFEANSLYGAVVDDDGCAVGVFGVPEITQVFRRPSAVGASGNG